tara:strand:- start:1077 stop:1241 length:165 start_codon:yes stop_codon:yes gene_type:complete
MKLAELVGELSAYPEDIEVRILADLGGMLEMKIESVVDSTEFSEESPPILYITT